MRSSTDGANGDQHTSKKHEANRPISVSDVHIDVADYTGSHFKSSSTDGANGDQHGSQTKLEGTRPLSASHVHLGVLDNKKIPIRSSNPSGLDYQISEGNTKKHLAEMEEKISAQLRSKAEESNPRKTSGPHLVPSVMPGPKTSSSSKSSRKKSQLDNSELDGHQTMLKTRYREDNFTNLNALLTNEEDFVPITQDSSRRTYHNSATHFASSQQPNGSRENQEGHNNDGYDTDSDDACSDLHAHTHHKQNQRKHSSASQSPVRSSVLRKKSKSRGVFKNRNSLNSKSERSRIYARTGVDNLTESEILSDIDSEVYYSANDDGIPQDLGTRSAAIPSNSGAPQMDHTRGPDDSRSFRLQSKPEDQIGAGRNYSDVGSSALRQSWMLGDEENNDAYLDNDYRGIGHENRSRDLQSQLSDSRHVRFDSIGIPPNRNLDREFRENLDSQGVRDGYFSQQIQNSARTSHLPQSDLDLSRANGGSVEHLIDGESTILGRNIDATNSQQFGQLINHKTMENTDTLNTTLLRGANDQSTGAEDDDRYRSFVDIARDPRRVRNTGVMHGHYSQNTEMVDNNLESGEGDEDTSDRIYPRIYSPENRRSSKSNVFRLDPGDDTDPKIITNAEWKIQKAEIELRYAKSRESIANKKYEKRLNLTKENTIWGQFKKNRTLFVIGLPFSIFVALIRKSRHKTALERAKRSSERWSLRGQAIKNELRSAKEELRDRQLCDQIIQSGAVPAPRVDDVYGVRGKKDAMKMSYTDVKRHNRNGIDVVDHSSVIRAAHIANEDNRMDYHFKELAMQAISQDQERINDGKNPIFCTALMVDSENQRSRKIESFLDEAKLDKNNPLTAFFACEHAYDPENALKRYQYNDDLQSEHYDYFAMDKIFDRARYLDNDNAVNLVQSKTKNPQGALRATHVERVEGRRIQNQAMAGYTTSL